MIAMLFVVPAVARVSSPVKAAISRKQSRSRPATLAVGATISCRAYRDGMQETDGEPMPRWVYVGETLHPILPPPPP